MLGFMAVSGIFGLRNLQKLDLSVKFPDEIYCDIPTQLTLQLTSAKKHSPPLPADTPRPNGAEADFPILRPRERKRSRRLLVTFHKRGRGTITKAAVISPFPVNFFVRSNLFSLDAAYLVFPKPLPPPDGLAS